LCYHTETNEYLLFPSQEELALQSLLQKLPFPDFVTISSMAHDTHISSSTTSTTSTKKVSLGTIRSPVPHLSSSSSSSYEWFPDVITDQDVRSKFLKNGYYRLPNDTVVFPIVIPTVESSLYVDRVLEVLLWLDFFAIHTVLAMFGMEQNVKPIFIIHNEHNGNLDALLSSPLWSIFGNETSRHMGQFQNNIGKHQNIIPIHGDLVDDTTLPITVLSQSQLVCFPQSVAGLGRIATIRDESNHQQLLTHAMGRGVLIHTFRHYILSNLGILSESLPKDVVNPNVLIAPYRFQITIAGMTETEFTILESALRSNEKSFQKKWMDLHIQQVDHHLSFQESMALTATSFIHITYRHAGRPLTNVLATATCLPPGATLIVLFHPRPPPEDTTSTKRDDLDVRVDQIEQDYLEMIGDLNLHWLMIPSSSLSAKLPGHQNMDEVVKTNILTIVHNKLQSFIDETMKI
jgi:hypothetical protein